MELYHFSPELLFYWLVAYSVFQWLSINIILLFSNNRFNAPIEYYSKIPSIISISSDFIYSTIILITGHLIFKAFEDFKFINKYNELTKIIIFILLIIIIQWIYDLIFAYVIYKSPSKYSKYIDLFKIYIKEASFGAVIADTIWITLYLLTTLLFIKYLSLPVAALILFISLFIWLVVKY